MSNRLFLVAASDDFLLEEGLRAARAECAKDLQGVQPEELPEDITPENLALELCSPSLFEPQRLLVVPEIRPWLKTTTPAEATVIKSDADLAPLLQLLSRGLPEGMALIMGSWCGRKPRGELVDAVRQEGRFEWYPAPPPPKPWEDIALSGEQVQVLSRILHQSLGGTPINRDAERMLLERLGFKPRLLAQEAEKLAAAAGGAAIDLSLLRSLVLPKERSLEVIRDSLLKAELTPLFDLLSAHGAGYPIVDYSGKTMDSGAFPPTVFATIWNLLHQFLFLKELAAACGLEDEMTVSRTRRKGWHNSVFKSRIAPKLEQRMASDMPFPTSRSGRAPSTWTLGQLFAGASRYSRRQLVAALAQSGDVEAATRSPMPVESLVRWIADLRVGASPVRP